jgi:RNA polymerase sigma factor (sigma-70 family)
MHTTLPVNADRRYEDVSGMSYLAVDQYQRELAWVEPFSDEEQEKLLTRVLRARCSPENAHYALLAKDARDRLVEAYQPLVYQAARRWVRKFQSMELMDAVQEGNLGLLQAIDRHVPGPDRCFTHFARKCIRQAIYFAFRYVDPMVKVCAWRVQQKIDRVIRLKMELSRRSGRSATSEEVAQEGNMKCEEVEELLAFAQLRTSVVSLEGLFVEDENEDHCDFVSLFHSSCTASQADQDGLVQLMHEAVETALTKRQRDVIPMRYGLDGQCYTQAEAASVLGISFQSVSHAERRAKERLRMYLAPRLELAV